MLSLQAGVDLEVMAMTGYSATPKALALLEPHLFSIICRTLVGGGAYHSAEIQSVYSRSSANWGIRRLCNAKAIIIERQM